LESLALAVAVGLALGLSTFLSGGCVGVIVDNRRRIRLGLSGICHCVDNDMVKVVDDVQFSFYRRLGASFSMNFLHISTFVRVLPVATISAIFLPSVVDSTAYTG
jgi:hypothetical protein